MFESKGQPVLPLKLFYRRLAANAALAITIIGWTLGMGMAGYHFLGDLPWIDALVNASMLLGGMGPVDPVRSTAGKLFASFYALFCGLVLIAATAILSAPVFHRFLHRFHMDMDEEDVAREQSGKGSEKQGAENKRRKR